MDGLTFLLIGLSAVFVGDFLFHARKQSLRGRTGIGGICLAILLVSVVIYFHTGHFSDWKFARADTEADPMLAAKITVLERELTQHPADIERRKELAVLLMQAGSFSEAVKTLNEALRIGGSSPSVWGLKARALYYRDGRKLSSETLEAVNTAQKLEQFEPRSLMLLAEDAYHHRKYAQAVQIWQQLLDSGNAGEFKKAIQSAVVNAKRKINASEEKEAP